MVKICLNKEKFLAIMKEKRLTKTETARLMGIDRSLLYKVLHGKVDLGCKFIEGALDFSDARSMDDLFFLTRVGSECTTKEEKVS